MRTQFFAMLLLAVPLPAACASNSTSNSETHNGVVTDGGADEGDGASCDGVSENVVPTGTCSTGAGPCPVYVPAHCTDAGNPENSKDYSCSCPAGAWQCEVVNTGLSLPVCEGG